MFQPESLKSEDYQPWSRGRGVDVWAMFLAAASGDIDAMKTLVAKNPQLLECEYDYRNPLYFAVRENQQNAVEFLLQKGANPVDGFHEPLLQMAEDRDNQEMLILLKSWLRDRYHIIPEGDEIAALIRNGEAAKVLLLLEEKPELIAAADQRGNQPIHWAVMTRQLELIDELLARGADINATRPDGARPLHLTNGDYHYRGWRDVPRTALRPHEVLLGFLIARGAEYDISTAAKIGDLARVRQLLDEHPALANAVPDYSTYYSGLPLRCAAGAGHLEIVQLLLERGADPNGAERVAPWGGALYEALGGKHAEIIRLLLQYGANPNAAVESSGSCLWRAMRDNIDQELIEELIAHGAVLDVKFLCYDENIPALAAILHANPQTLITEEAMNYAFENNHRRLVELILRYQPDILKNVCMHSVKDTEWARELIQHGLNPGRANWLGVTPLHKYAAAGDLEMANICLEFGTDINAIDDEYSSTPLVWAARCGQTEMVKVLLEHGAKVLLPEDKLWAHAMQWARRRGHDEIAELL